MVTIILRYLPSIVIGIPISYIILRHYFKGSVFFKIGMMWVTNIFLTMIITSLAANFPEMFPLWLSTTIGIGVPALMLAYSGKLLKPLREATDRLNKLSSGDLNVRLDLKQRTRNDEIGKIINSIANLQDNLKNVISEIQASAELLNIEGSKINETSRQLLDSANFQASSIEEISSSMEEMVSNIQQNAENSGSTKSMSVKAAHSMRQVADSSNANLEAINTISERIRVINDIAFQTNLLALNAAVEAARAGEHGRGFSVVATEVRKLAEKSKQAANEIIASTINTVEITRQAADLINHVLPDINTTMTLTQEIYASSEEQRIGSDQINEAIIQLNEKAQESTMKADLLNVSAVKLNAKAEEMKQTISFFRIV
jgi:methyl-accepting chemotaxis protein